MGVAAAATGEGGSVTVQGSLFPVAPILLPSKAKGRPLAPGKNDPIHDLVVTPDWLAVRIVDYLDPSGILLDPARGSGAFYRALRRHSKDVRWCEKAAGIDFFHFHEQVDWIITNPPWSKMRKFIQHAMTLAPNIAFVGTVQQFTLKARLADMRAAGFGLRLLAFAEPPLPWPRSGFQPAVGHLQRGASFPFEWLPDQDRHPLQLEMAS
jgi:hypothetical protein